MALENINEAVLSQARTEAEHILKVARKTAEEKVQAARESIEREGERRYQAAVRAIEEEFARSLIQAKGAANKELLNKKNQCLQTVFDAAKQQILGFSSLEYTNAMRKLLENAAGTGGGMLRIHPDDKPCFDMVLADFNIGRAPGTEVRIDTAQPLPTRDGFVFVGEGFEVDQTLSTLLEDIQRELAPHIAADLFSE